MDRFFSYTIAGVSLGVIFSALLLLLVCYIVIQILMKAVKKGLERTKLEGALKNFVASLVKALLWILTAIIVASELGIPSASLVALLSVAGLAFSLALQGTLSSVFAGFVILATKPFKTGDYVEIGATGGVVTTIGLFYTTLLTADNKEISIPNTEVSSSRVTDYTTEPERRIDLSFEIGYDFTAEEARRALLEAVNADARTITTAGREPVVVVSEYKASSVTYLLRFWVKNADYWDAYYAVNESAREYLQKNSVCMASDHLIVKVEK